MTRLQTNNRRRMTVFRSISFDLQSVLQVPSSDASLMYHKRLDAWQAQREPARHSVVLDCKLVPCHYITRAKVCLLSVI